MAQVLVVDDELTMREQLYDALARHRHTVTSAASGPQALELLKHQRPQFIVVGVPLPQSLQVIEHIRAFDATIPLVVLAQAGSAAISPEDRRRLKIIDVLPKESNMDLLLARLEPELARCAALHEPSSPAAGAPAHGTVLVVDDDEQIHRLLKWFFASHGLQVIIAGSGEEGWQALAQQPSLVLLDVNMPGMDGIMMLKKIKARYPAMPVVMISGAGDEAVAKEALRLGAQDYISKPFNMDYLETVVLEKVRAGIKH
jgi:DNA-binding response OmpR family regulator